MTTAERIAENNRRTTQIIQAAAKMRAGCVVKELPFGRLEVTQPNGIVYTVKRETVAALIALRSK